jgi:conjugal transfer pilus assembly protein TrbC
VTEADIDRVRRAQPVITDADIERAKRAHRMPTELELSRVPVPSAPNVDALPKPRVTQPVDLADLAKGYDEALGSAMPASGLITRQPGLFIFVSFSLPERTLLRLIEQAARAQATLVMRGLVNGSLRETVAQVQRLMGDRKVSFQIDPQAFDRFSVLLAPTFVLVRGGARPSDCAAGTCFATDAFLSVAGDVSLDYALEHFSRTTPAFRKEATTFLRRLQKGRP